VVYGKSRNLQNSHFLERDLIPGFLIGKSISAVQVAGTFDVRELCSTKKKSFEFVMVSLSVAHNNAATDNLRKRKFDKIIS
jgi:hypothetical protein